MALINCKECGKEISENATACPNCGNPNTLTKEEKQAEIKKKENDNAIAGVITFIFVIVIVGCIFGAISWWDNNDMDNKAIDGFVDGVDTVTNMYVDYEYDKAREKELKNRIYDVLDIK